MQGNRGESWGDKMYLGIDVGTSSVKVTLIDEKGMLVATSLTELAIAHPKPLYSEQNPHEWWSATCSSVAQLKKMNPKQMAAVRGIGLSGQQHGATLLDASGAILRPAILWNDGRSFQECAFIEKRVPHCWEITGNRIYPGFTAPKLVWVQKHEPEIFAKIAKVLLPKDYLRFRMTGEYFSDVSDASGTSWLDISKRAWSDEMLDVCSLKRSHMPELCEGTDITASVTNSIASEWGIPPKTPVVGGAGDNPAGAISVNCVAPSDAFLSLGTSGVYFVASKKPSANPKGGVHTMCHAIPNMWHQMTVHLSAASCFDFLKNVTHASSVPDLINGVETHFSKTLPVYFLPFLSGERTPYNNPYARGVFFGLEHKTRNVSLMQAIMEGIAFNFANGQNEMEKVAIDIGDVSVVGGGSKSIFFGKILASALNRPLYYRKDREVGASLGAARLALLGVEKKDPSDAFANSPIEHVVHPDPSLVDLYEKKRGIFTSLYYELEPSFKRSYELFSKHSEDSV